MSMPLPDHPMQPIYRDEAGVTKFRGNAIIAELVDHGVIDLNKIAVAARGLPQADIDQFWQLLGYSVGGYSELAADGLISREAADRAEKVAAKMKEAEKGKAP